MRNDLIIEKMIQIIEKIQRYTRNLDYESFSDNDLIIDACIFNLSQLGETANRVDEQYELSHPEISWREIYGLRNRIVHDYEGINLKLVWEIIEWDLPELLKTLETI
ncbi:MAG: DUF86 domain-containing protein [Clostridiales bacterium]|nr:DUF86 domain-containing protein [Clostridiales bacterium]